jgi:ABC-2 type transport system ATP-binding protein
MIKVANLNKKYANKTVLHDLSFEMKKGEILGLLGPNGSGKTTLMNILAGTTKKTNGSISIGNHNIGQKTKSIVSYLPENNHLYHWMKVKDAEAFYDVHFDDFDIENFAAIKDRFELRDNEQVTNMSKGAMQKLRLGLTLSRKAQVFLLDEPLGGIDTLSREEVVELIFDCISEDVTIIIATHLINEVERLFDQALFLKNGKKILFEDCDSLRSVNNASIKNVYLEIMKNA